LAGAGMESTGRLREARNPTSLPDRPGPAGTS